MNEQEPNYMCIKRVCGQVIIEIYLAISRKELLDFTFIITVVDTQWILFFAIDWRFGFVKDLFVETEHLYNSKDCRKYLAMIMMVIRRTKRIV